MFDISKNSYHFTSYLYINYEVIIDYVKNLLLKLKAENTHNNIEVKKPFILINSDFFKFLKLNDTIEITFVSKKNIKVLFKLSKDNLSKNCDKNISINGYAVDLITKTYNFNPIKEKILVHKMSPENISLSKIVIELSEYAPRSELFNITLNMLNDTVIKGQEIYNKDKKIIGVISKLSNDSFSGLVTSSTTFTLNSLNSDIYLMFDISKNSYHYTSYLYINYEVIIDYVKNLLLKLKAENTHHNIHIIFYIRIFFKSKKDYTIYNFIRKAYDEQANMIYYHFDIYDKIETFNVENVEINEVIYKMNRVYQIYDKIQSYAHQKKNFENLNQFLFHIRDNLQYPITEEEKRLLLLNKDILSFSFEGYELPYKESKNNRECFALEDNIFTDVENFEISGFNEIAIFEALFFDIDLIAKNKNKKYNPLINIVLSAPSFPYYCEALSDKVNSSINEEYIHLIFTFLCQKKCVSGKINPEYYINIGNKKAKVNDDYLVLDNKLSEIPPWCKIYYITHASLYDNLHKYKMKYKNFLSDKNISSIYKLKNLEIFDEKYKLNILNMNLEPNDNTDKFNINKNINSTSEIINLGINTLSLKKELYLEDILQIYSIKKTCPDKSKDNQSGIFFNEENDYLRISSSNNDSSNIHSQNDEREESILNDPLDNNDKNGFENSYNDGGIDALEYLFTHVTVPFFLEKRNKNRIEPDIVKCYSTKKNKNLILKRIDRNFNLIIENDSDETLNLIKNMINNPTEFNEKFLMTNRKVLNILEFKTFQTDVLQYNIQRKDLFFTYNYLVSNSINGSVFQKTNKQVKKISLQDMDNNLID